MSGLKFTYMADFDRLSAAVHGAAEGFVRECMGVLSVNAGKISDLIREQLYSGLDGKGNYLSPNYDDDPYFNEDGPWKGRPDAYKRWKGKITPPMDSYLMHLPPRPLSVPNLIITGSFYGSIRATVNGESVDVVSSGFVDGADILRKYGDDILLPGYNARLYINENILRPWLDDFFRKYGLI